MDADADAATSLRAELKQWEKTFTLQNSRKPGREDIKSNPAIGRSPLSIYQAEKHDANCITAEKYKEYARLRSDSSQQTGKENGGGKEKAKAKAKASVDQHTPKRTKRHCPFEDDSPTAKPKICTPSRTVTAGVGAGHPSRLDPYDSPSNIRRLNGARDSLPLYEAIGPTPQRDGKALGLFDLLGSPGQKTPRASRQSVVNDNAHGNGTGVAQTPSRKGKVPGTPSTVRMPQKLFGKGISSFAKRLQEQNTEKKEGVDEQSEDRVEETQIFSDQGRGVNDEDNGDGDVHRSPSKTHKTYKKKGQKRTTKLSRLKPSRAKPAAQPVWESLVEESEDELAAAETTAPPAEHDGSSDDPDDDEAYIPKNHERNPKKSVKSVSKTAAEKKPRKIKAEAHANYRSLKIRSRGGQKGGGRFGRR
ncbi:DNA replication regulator sld2 [Trichophyton equinum CBS 127.97]|uniref:DNA replication regulator SLD2 n=1 Tax=Trichophyton equinum (strain ATCC MYA-4606 / CBS 127.97) TaxID=559882 RepID=F2PL64_TRIEC|nr:DNA replication regulator sld2 [Trichophyton equinum CBS 127.97]